MQSDTLLPKGTKLGEYEIAEKIGAGGMAVVYKAIQYMHNHQRIVAVKVLDINLLKANREEFEERFIREARTLAHLEHPHILRIYNSNRTGNYYWIAMQHISRGTLRQELKRKQGNPLPVERVHALVDPICKALAYAHRNGVVHRDLKPANILIDDDGNPYISDFGIARIISDTQIGSADRSVTQFGITMGTLDYMAPEQRMDARGADERADIFSMGIMTFQMLTGHLPDRGNNYLTPNMHIERDLTQMGYSSELAEVLEIATAIQVDDRYNHINEFLEAFNIAIAPMIHQDSATNPSLWRAKQARLLERKRELDEQPTESLTPRPEDQAMNYPNMGHGGGGGNSPIAETPTEEAPSPKRGKDDSHPSGQNPQIAIHSSTRAKRPAKSFQRPIPVQSNYQQPPTQQPYRPRQQHNVHDSGTYPPRPSDENLDNISREFVINSSPEQIDVPRICPVCLEPANKEVKVPIGGAIGQKLTAYYCNKHGELYNKHSILFYVAHGVVLAIVGFLAFLFTWYGAIGGLIIYGILWPFLDDIRPPQAQRPRQMLKVKKKGGKLAFKTGSRRYARHLQKNNANYLERL